MDLSILTAIAILQGVFVLLLLALVAAGHWAGSLRIRRSGVNKLRAEAAIREWLKSGRSDEGRLRRLDELPFHSVSAALQSAWAEQSAEDWNALADALRATDWARRMRRFSWSVFWWRRLACARMLAMLATSEDAPVVQRLLGDRRAAVRFAAAEVVPRIPTVRLVESVFELAGSSGAVVRGHLLELLARSRAQLAPVLSEKLRDVSDYGRLRIALDLAGQIGAPELLDRIRPLASIPNMEVRIAATRALGAVDDPQSVVLLIGLLQDSHWQVRTQAAASLGALGAVDACDVLRDAMRDRSWWVRLRAGLALRALGRPGRQVLEEIDPASDLFAYQMAQYVLGLAETAIRENASGSAITYDATARGRAA